MSSKQPTQIDRQVCQAEGCEASTRDSKPFCPDHVELNPYARRIAEQLEAAQARREREADED